METTRRNLILPATSAALYPNPKARSVYFDGNTVLASPGPIYDASTPETSSLIWSYWFSHWTMPDPGNAYTVVAAYPTQNSTNLAIAIRHYRSFSSGKMVWNLFIQNLAGTGTGAVYTSTEIPADGSLHHICGAAETATGNATCRLDGTPMQPDRNLTKGTGLPFNFPARGNSWLIGGDYFTTTQPVDQFNGVMAELYLHMSGHGADDWYLFNTPRQLLSLGGQGFAIRGRDGILRPMPLGPHGLAPLGIGENVPVLVQRGDETSTPPPVGGFKWNFWSPPFQEITGQLQPGPYSPWDL